MDEPLYQSLLTFRFNAEQLASLQPACLPGILKSQPLPAVLYIGHHVAWALRSTPTDPLTWTQQSGEIRRSKHYTCRNLSDDFSRQAMWRNSITNLQYHQKCWPKYGLCSLITATGVGTLILQNP